MQTRVQRIVADGCLLLALFATPLHAEEKKDLFGDPLPPGAIARLGSTRFSTGEPIRVASLSQDGKTILAGCIDTRGPFNKPTHHCTVYLLNAKDGKVEGRTEEFEGVVLALAAPADRKQVWIIVGAGGRGGATLRRYALDDKRWEKDVVVASSQRPDSLKFSADEKLVVLESSDGAEVFDRDAKAVRFLTAVKACAYCPTTNLIACDKEAKIELFRASDGKLERSVELGEIRPKGLGFSPDGKWLAVLAQVPDRRGPRLEPDPRGGTVPQLPRMNQRNYEVHLFDDTGKRVLSREGYTSGRGDSVLFSPDGALFAVDDVWSTKTGEAVGPRLGTPVAFLDGGKRLVVNRGFTLEVWDTSKWTIQYGEHIDTDPQYFRSAISPDEKLLATMGRSGVIQLWEIETGKHRWRFEPAEIEVTGLAFAPDGKQLILASQGRLTPCSIEAPKLGKHVPCPDPDWSSKVLATSPDGKYLAVGSRSAIDIYSPELRLLHSLAPKAVKGDNRFEPSELYFSPDGKHVTGIGVFRNLGIWEIATQKEVCWSDKNHHIVAGFRGDDRFAHIDMSGTVDGGKKDHRLKTINISDGAEVEDLDLKTKLMTNSATIVDGVLISLRMKDGLRLGRPPADKPAVIPLSKDAPPLTIKNDDYIRVLPLRKTRRFVLMHNSGTALVYELPPRKAAKD